MLSVFRISVILVWPVRALSAVFQHCVIALFCGALAERRRHSSICFVASGFLSATIFLIMGLSNARAMNRSP